MIDLWKSIRHLCLFNFAIFFYKNLPTGAVDLGFGEISKIHNGRR